MRLHKRSVKFYIRHPLQIITYCLCLLVLSSNYTPLGQQWYRVSALKVRWDG